MNEDEGEPLLRVVRGAPTAQELAALVAVVATRSRVALPGPPPRGEWGTPARSVRAPLHPGSDGWRRSGLPR